MSEWQQVGESEEDYYRRSIGDAPPDIGHNRPDECACGQRIGINTRAHAKGCDYEWQNGMPLVETY